MAGHVGKEQTLDKISTLFFWPKMRKDIAVWTAQCPVCQGVGNRVATTQMEMGTIPVVSELSSIFEVDLLGPLISSKSNKRFILVVCDRASRYLHAVPLCAISVLAVARELLTYFSRVGFPKMIVSDRGTQFVSALVA